MLQAIDGSPASCSIRLSIANSPRLIDERCREMGVASVNVLEPVLNAFQIYLGAPSRVGSARSMS